MDVTYFIVIRQGRGLQYLSFPSLGLSSSPVPVCSFGQKGVPRPTESGDTELGAISSGVPLEVESLALSLLPPKPPAQNIWSQAPEPGYVL